VGKEWPARSFWPLEEPAALESLGWKVRQRKVVELPAEDLAVLLFLYSVHESSVRLRDEKSEDVAFIQDLFTLWRETDEGMEHPEQLPDVEATESLVPHSLNKQWVAGPEAQGAVDELLRNGISVTGQPIIDKLGQQAQEDRAEVRVLARESEKCPVALAPGPEKRLSALRPSSDDACVVKREACSERDALDALSFEGGDVVPLLVVEVLPEELKGAGWLVAYR
jgi:hypothetical protein